MSYFLQKGAELQTLYLLSLIIIEVCVVDHAVLSLPVPGCDGVGGGSDP